jgi:hypothetical protein
MIILLTSIPDEALITINSLEIIGIIYLAIAISKLSQRISKIEGREEGKEKQAELNHIDKG